MDEISRHSVENPLDPEHSLELPLEANERDEDIHPQKLPLQQDSAITKAEKVERHGLSDNVYESPVKRIKLEQSDDTESQPNNPIRGERRKGVAPVKPESVL